MQAVEDDWDGLTQRRHQLGLAAAAPLAQLTKLRELTKWASGAADLASFLNDVSSPGRIDQQVRSRWIHLRDTVADIHAEGSATSPAAEVDELAFLVAASMRVWIVEVEDEGRDFRHCLDRLADVVPPGSPVDAPYSLYLHLADVAQTRGPRSGGLTAAELRAELERRQVPLRSGPRQPLSPRAAIPQVSIPGHIGRELVERPELIEQLISVLLAKGVSRPAKAVSAVRGVGGIGKTTLVGQACSRMEVQANFTGGVLWITIGETATGAELARRVNDLVERLTGARPSLSDPEQAGFQLGEALDAHEEGLLLVLDDVWTEEQLRPFLLGGHSCRRLITTRNHALLPGIPSLHVEKMTHEQATALLTRGLVAIPSSVADELVRLNFRWPVLLELTNRALHRKHSPV